MTKGRAVLPGRVVAENKQFFITLGGTNGFHSATTLSGGAPLPFVISTEAQRFLGNTT
jgi:hypothetical protein